MKSRILPSLTGFRAIAALLVYLHHFPMGWPFEFAQAVTKEGHVGVTLFFVLSGFLIAYRYADTVQWGRAEYRKYWLARFARIYPIYAVLTALLYFSVAPDFTYTGAFLNFTLLRGFFNDLKFTGIAQAWSLTVEECFYLVAPLFFIAWKSGRPGRRILALVLVPLCGAGLVAVSAPAAASTQGFFGNWPFMLLYTLGGRWLEFFLGALTAISIKPRIQAPGGASGTPKWTYVGAASVLLLIYAMSRLAPDPSIQAAVGNFGNFGLFSSAGIFLNNVLLPLGVCSLLAGLALEQSRLNRLLSSPTLVLLGKSSYVFYLIHVGVIRDSLITNVSSNPLVLFILLVMIAICLYLFVEEPLQRRIRRDWLSEI